MRSLRRDPLTVRPPCPPLRAVVASYELLARESGGVVTARMWPSAAGQLVFNAGDSVRSADLELRCGDAVVLGPTRVARIVRGAGRIDLLTCACAPRAWRRGSARR